MTVLDLRFLKEKKKKKREEATYQIDHVDHGGISCNKHQERDLDGITPLNIARFELIGEISSELGLAKRGVC